MSPADLIMMACAGIVLGIVAFIGGLWLAMRLLEPGNDFPEHREPGHIADSDAKVPAGAQH